MRVEVQWEGAWLKASLTLVQPLSFNHSSDLESCRLDAELYYDKDDSDVWEEVSVTYAESGTLDSIFSADNGIIPWRLLKEQETQICSSTRSPVVRMATECTLEKTPGSPSELLNDALVNIRSELSTLRDPNRVQKLFTISKTRGTARRGSFHDVGEHCSSLVVFFPVTIRAALPAATAIRMGKEIPDDFGFLRRAVNIGLAGGGLTSGPSQMAAGVVECEESSFSSWCNLICRFYQRSIDKEIARALCQGTSLRDGRLVVPGSPIMEIGHHGLAIVNQMTVTGSEIIIWAVYWKDCRLSQSTTTSLSVATPLIACPGVIHKSPNARDCRIELQSTGTRFAFCDSRRGTNLSRAEWHMNQSGLRFGPLIENLGEVPGSLVLSGAFTSIDKRMISSCSSALKAIRQHL